MERLAEAGVPPPPALDEDVTATPA